MAEFICESCNKEFDKPEKMNRTLSVIGLVVLYWFLLSVMDTLPGISSVFATILIGIAGSIHVIYISLFKEIGRGKCPCCKSKDFVSTDSIKGHEIISKLKKLRASNKKD